MSIDGDDSFPSKGDKLFRADFPDWQNNACLNVGRTELSKWYTYVDGYKEAADLLAGRILEGNLVIDILVYPIAYLYRHHVELVLKTLIIIGSQYKNEKPPSYGHHRLRELWKHARRYIEVFWHTDDPEALDAAEKLVFEFDQLDINSFAFRYPVTKQGSDSLPSVTNINVRHFAEMASRLGYFLTCCMTGMDVELDTLREQLADMLSEVDPGYRPEAL